MYRAILQLEVVTRRDLLDMVDRRDILEVMDKLELVDKLEVVDMLKVVDKVKVKDRMEEFDVVVVGAGMIGSSAAKYIARKVGKVE